MIKKILATLIGSALFTQTAEAMIIELDNMNPDHCRQQILRTLSTKDPEDMQFPVIFTYMKHCPWADKLRPIIEQVSNEMPNRVFYAFNFKDEEHPERNYIAQAQTCLGFLPFASPSVSLYVIGNDGNMPVRPMILGEYRRGLNGMSTKQEVEDFIKIDSTTLKAITLPK